jgi:hypothetical protein
MTISTSSNTQIRVNPGDWKHNKFDLPYMGKYQVGCFTLGYEFMIQYMHLVHRIPTNIDNASCNMTNENAVMYMQQCDIIDNRILSQMREMVKNLRMVFPFSEEIM